MNGQEVHVLVVDDDEQVRQGFERALAGYGFRVTLAASGEEGLTLAHATRPEVILLDVMMPGLTGFEVCRALKDDAETRAIPVVLVTALAGVETLREGYDAGAEEFVTKPVRGLELRARLRAMARIHRQHAELARLMRLQEDLAHMLVHDLRGPLTSIAGYTSLLSERRDIPAVVGPELAAIRNQVGRAERLLTDLLLTAKLDQGRLQPQRTHSDMARLARDAVDAAQAAAHLRDVTLELEVREPVDVSVDESLVIRVLDNLVSNALKFSPRGGRVRVSATPRSGDYTSELRVSDQGPGIAPEYREMVFDKFGVVEVREKAGLQLGLGLAFCKLAVEAHGGRIWVAPAEPRGSTFVMQI